MPYFFLLLKASIKKRWYAFTNKYLEIYSVHLHAPIAINQASNYIEWTGNNISHAYIKNAIKTKLVKGTRYYFINNLEHKNITLILEGYNDSKTYSYQLNYISINKNKEPRASIINNLNWVKNTQFKLNIPRAIKTSNFVLNNDTLDKSKIKTLELINLKSSELNRELTKESPKTNI